MTINVELHQQQHLHFPMCDYSLGWTLRAVQHIQISQIGDTLYTRWAKNFIKEQSCQACFQMNQLIQGSKWLNKKFDTHYQNIQEVMTRTWISHIICCGCSFMFNELRWEVIVCFMFNELRWEVIVCFMFNELR